MIRLLLVKNLHNYSFLMRTYKSGNRSKDARWRSQITWRMRITGVWTMAIIDHVADAYKERLERDGGRRPRCLTSCAYRMCNVAIDTPRSRYGQRNRHPCPPFRFALKLQISLIAKEELQAIVCVREADMRKSVAPPCCHAALPDG